MNIFFMYEVVEKVTLVILIKIYIKYCCEELIKIFTYFLIFIYNHIFIFFILKNFFRSA